MVQAANMGRRLIEGGTNSCTTVHQFIKLHNMNWCITLNKSATSRHQFTHPSLSLCPASSRLSLALCFSFSLSLSLCRFSLSLSIYFKIQ